MVCGTQTMEERALTPLWRKFETCASSMVCGTQTMEERRIDPSLAQV